MSTAEEGSLPCFFLAEPPGERPPQLAQGGAEHALKALRMKPGDHLEAIDGEGSRWRLKIVAATQRQLGLETVGPPLREPAPGDPEAPLPWIEVNVAWPRKNRGADMLGRLVQLGAAAVNPMTARHQGPWESPSEPPERWFRIAREACKQSGRSWLPRLGSRVSPQSLAEDRKGCPIALLDPHRGMAFDTWARSLLPLQGGMGTKERPIVLAIGPEGGFAHDEKEALWMVGATSVRLTPHILRVETAAEAALAVAGTILAR